MFKCKYRKKHDGEQNILIQFTPLKLLIRYIGFVKKRDIILNGDDWWEFRLNNIYFELKFLTIKSVLRIIKTKFKDWILNVNNHNKIILDKDESDYHDIDDKCVVFLIGIQHRKESQYNYVLSQIIPYDKTEESHLKHVWFKAIDNWVEQGFLSDEWTGLYFYDLSGIPFGIKDKNKIYYTPFYPYNLKENIFKDLDDIGYGAKVARALKFLDYFEKKEIQMSNTNV